MISLLRAVRLLRGDSLDAVAASVKTRKGWLSTIERFPERHVSKELQGRLARYYGATWSALSRTFDGAAFSSSLLEHFNRNGKTN